MRRVGFVLAAVLVLLASAAAAYFSVNTLVGSLYEYSSPIKGALAQTEDTSRPLTSQVVLVVVDGLRFDAAAHMPYLQTLRKQGAHARMLLRDASGSVTTWTALLTGARPEINAAPLFDPNPDQVEPMTADSLFATVNRTGLTNGVAASRAWQNLVPFSLLYTQFFAEGEGSSADRQIVDRSLVFLQEFRPNFLVVHLTQVNSVGMRYGAASNEYVQAVQSADDLIRQLAAAMNLARSTLIVVSSHGLLDQGGYGGDEPVLLEVPFVMAGEDVFPGDYRTMDQADLAPTIAVLLGTPIPASAQGNARLEMLRIDETDKAERLAAEASQKVHLGNAYLGSIGRGSVSETAEGDMLVALSSLQVKNYDSAARLASLASRQAGLEMSTARNSLIWNERRRRATVVGAGAISLLWLIWRWRGRHTRWTLLAAVAAAASYHLLLWYQGSIYSFSQLPPQQLASTLLPSLRRAALSLALGALFVVLPAWREREQSIFVVVRRTFAFAIVLVYLVGLGVAACTVWSGARLTWYVPNLRVTFVHCTLLIQCMTTALLAIPLPIVVLPIQRALVAITRRSS